MQDRNPQIAQHIAATIAAEIGAQTAQAKAMSEESFKDFERVAKSEAGAHSARMLGAFKEGTGFMVDGQPFAPGMFIRSRGGEASRKA